MASNTVLSAGLCVEAVAIGGVAYWVYLLAGRVEELSKAVSSLSEEVKDIKDDAKAMDLQAKLTYLGNTVARQGDDLQRLVSKIGTIKSEALEDHLDEIDNTLDALTTAVKTGSKEVDLAPLKRRKTRTPLRGKSSRKYKKVSSSESESNDDDESSVLKRLRSRR